MKERLMAPALLAGGLVLLVVVAVAGWEAGQGLGEPEEVEIDRAESPSVPAPPVEGGLLGYEGINDRMRLGLWGTLTDAETGEDGSLMMSIAVVDGVETTARLAPEASDRVRLLEPLAGEVARGDRVTVLEGEDGVTVVVTRPDESSEQ